MASERVLEFSELVVTFHSGGRVLTAVDKVSLGLERGKSLGIVGESGSGKSAMLLGLLGLLSTSGASTTMASGRLAGIDIAGISASESRRLLRQKVGVILQDPLTSLNPVMRVGSQIDEVLRMMSPRTSRPARRATAARALEDLGFRDPEGALRQYPHELSGGMRQRVAIAMSMVKEPEIIFADEPTTALDVTVQAQTLRLLQEVRRRASAALVLVSHDLAVIAQETQYLAVMYSGQVVEFGPTSEVIAGPRHPYTAALLRSTPTLDDYRRSLSPIRGQPPRPEDTATGCRFAPRCEVAQTERCASEAPILRSAGTRDRLVSCHFPLEGARIVDEFGGIPLPTQREPIKLYDVGGKGTTGTNEVLIEVRDLARHYKTRKSRKSQVIRALDGVDLTIRRASSVGIVGESGSGKSTLARILAGHDEPTRGSVSLLGDARGETLSISGAAGPRSPLRVQMVLQDPSSSLDPRMTIGRSLKEALRGVTGKEGSNVSTRERSVDLLDEVGIGADAIARYPHEFSGGQRQRIAIARALAVRPQLLILDEPTSALDVSIQAQILALLRKLQAESGTAFVFISHDLAVVASIAREILVMTDGKVVERGETAQVVEQPTHPYTQRLIASAPRMAKAWI